MKNPFRSLLQFMRPDNTATAVNPLNYRLLAIVVILLTTTVSLVPLILVTAANYHETEKIFEIEFRLRATRIVLNIYHSFNFLLAERQAALHFIASSVPESDLKEADHMETLLDALRKSFHGGFEDLGVINAQSIQESYVGPHDLRGKDYSEQPWFKRVVSEEAYVSDVFLGFRKEPHLAIAVKKNLPDGSFRIIRTTMRIDPIDRLLAKLNLGGRGEVMITNAAGILQNNSRYHGAVLSRLEFPMPAFREGTNVSEIVTADNKTLLMSYRYIEKTPFVLMVVKDKQELLKPWRRTKNNLLVFLSISIAAIVFITVGSSILLTRKLYLMDQQRLKSLHQVEYEAKMGSIGRLAANVSHEINNPLAIINEKTGLMQDLIEFGKCEPNDPRFKEMTNSVLNAVKRASRITRNLLAFARHMEEGKEEINIKELVAEVISFLEKEAELKSIRIRIASDDDIPSIFSDRGELQQIFINVINNAFAAMDRNGELGIQINKQDKNHVAVDVRDTGYGIPQNHLHRIFEPFFSTKTGRGGTGLGLWVTYNLVQKIGGRISVQSEVAKGTCFTIALPLQSRAQEGTSGD